MKGNHLKFKSFTARVRQSNLTGEVGAAVGLTVPVSA